MRHIISADTYHIQLLLIQHGCVIRIAAHSLKAIAREELLRLARNQIRSRNNLHIRHLLIALDMGFRNPARSDDSYPELL